MSDGAAWVTHPWVAEGEQRVRFGVDGGSPRGDWSAVRVGAADVLVPADPGGDGGGRAGKAGRQWGWTPAGRGRPDAGPPRVLHTHHPLPTPDKIPFIIVAGTTEEATAYFRVLVDAGVRYVIVRPHDTETVRLLAEQVMPRFEVA